MAPVNLKHKDIILRDLIPQDLADHKRWLTTETQWMEWDAPWEEDDPEFNQSYLKRLERKLTYPLPAIRSTLEICHSSGAHIGMVNAYLINKDSSKLAVGITLRESRFWGGGLGSQAFLLWLAYQFKATGRQRVYCETWSGNIRMIKLAQKCNFSECLREPGIREIRGQIYDGLTFVLARDVFFAMHPDWESAVSKS